MTRRHRGGPLVLDLGVLGVNTKGVARVLTELAPRLFALAPDRYRAACTPAGLPVLRQLGIDDRSVVIRRVPNTAWEQVVLPGACARLGAGAVYSHQECGALWGPPLLLHVPEDPEIRWGREPTSDIRERARRGYSRLLMDRSLARAEVVVSTLATRDDLVRNHRLAPSRATVVPLGVDLDRFRPAADGRADPPYFFTLSSADDRDRTDLVLQAFARYRSAPGGRGRLVIGGSLGDRVEGLQRMAAQLGIAGEVELPGRLTDDELAGCNARAVATVHASSDEGFGLQPLEAMAGGSLLIATRTPSLEEVAVGAVVLWVDPTADAMAEAMARAGDDPGLAVLAGTENRRVAEGYSWDRTAGRLHELMVGLADR